MVDFGHLDYCDTTRTLHAVGRDALFDGLAGFAVLDVLDVFGGAGDHFLPRDFGGATLDGILHSSAHFFRLALVCLGLPWCSAVTVV